MLSLLSLALATYRIARLFAIDEGPFNMFFRIRYALGAYNYDETGQPSSAVGRMISCPHCLGLYVAPVLWGAMQLPHGDTIVLILAIAGAQSWLWSMAE